MGPQQTTWLAPVGLPGEICWAAPRPLRCPCVTSPGLSLQLRQGAVGLGPQEQMELKGTEAQSMRLIEVERSVSVGLWWARGWGSREQCPGDPAPCKSPPPPPNRIEVISQIIFEGF